EFAVTNLGPQPMPFQLGYHPYFAVADKKAARVDTGARRGFDNVAGREVEVPKAIDFEVDELDLHLLDHAPRGTTLARGAQPPIRLSWTEDFEVLVLWTVRGKPFV